MNEQRKKIIISEISYWKQKKLLPAHYCDFLIALYAQGNESEEDVEITESVLEKEKKRQSRIIGTLLLFTAILSVGIFMFDQYPILMLGSSGMILLVFLLYPIFNPAIRKSAILPFIYISSAMLLLAISLKIWTVFFSEQSMLLVGLLILNCALWLFAGRLLKLLYFTLSGAVGIILIIAFLIIQF